MRRTSIAILILGFITIFIVGCTKTDGANQKNTDITIYTSIYPIQFAVEQIAGDTADVHSVYPPGVDAHTYEPTSKDMTNIAKSDAFIYLGAGLEGFAENAADALRSEDVELVELGKNEHLFDKETNHTVSDHSHEDGEHADKAGAHESHTHGDHDPHVWLDPLRMITLSDMVKERLIKLNPDDKQLYENNFDQLTEQLQSLDADFTSVLEAATNKHILVSHAAYGYWEERYGLEQISINGLSPNHEPSQKELTEIIDQAENDDLHYIIFEQNTSNRISKVIQDHIQAQAVTIHNLSVLTKKDLENEEDYFSIMKKNLKTLDQVTS
ncbi:MULTISPECIES: metal ABC transporter solute-binding protein, Zn/Mn family [Virgibacillus]|uniref:Zinc transport system substrate-binding protein n=1 Tax=Virgibacillus chiguensis TaxID=411959 RepID=A0A1M5S520_9BACI|nr:MULTISPECIES: zinc ABC transporter substrate-binding protein [Virgibacillus]SHH33535.1 zinc transport system substrate-binding protein [Virgibacillus chiguensis]